MPFTSRTVNGSGSPWRVSRTKDPASALAVSIASRPREPCAACTPNSTRPASKRSPRERRPVAAVDPFEELSGRDDGHAAAHRLRHDRVRARVLGLIGVHVGGEDAEVAVGTERAVEQHAVIAAAKSERRALLLLDECERRVARFQVTAGLFAVVTTIIGSAAGANLCLLVLDSARESTAREPAAATRRPR
jgi:hypothetical protein